MRRIPFLILMLCLVFISLPSTAFAKNHKFTWEPEDLKITIGAGGTIDLQASFTSDESIHDAYLWVVPELQPFVEVDPVDFTHIEIGEEYTVNVRIQIPTDSKVGYYDGTIHLRSSKKTYPQNLKIRLNVVDIPVFTIGSNGGVASFIDPLSPIYRTSIEIPDEALTEEQPITMFIPSSPLNIPDHLVTAGVPVEFGPKGLTFNIPVRITMKFWDENDDGFIDGTKLHENYINILGIHDTGEMEFMEIEELDTVDNLVVFTTSSFSHYLPVLESSQSLSNWALESSGWNNDNSRVWDYDHCDAAVDFENPNCWIPFTSDHPLIPGHYSFGAPLPQDYPYTEDVYGLHILTHPASSQRYERVKLYREYDDDYDRMGEGLYTWEVWVPPVVTDTGGDRDNTVIAGFLFQLNCSSNCFELDFEIAHGPNWRRQEVGVSDNERLLYITIHNVPNIPLQSNRNDINPIVIPIGAQAYHSLQFRLTTLTYNLTELRIIIDDTWVFPFDIEIDESEWMMFASVENLPTAIGFGDKPAETDNHGYFKGISYRKSEGPACGQTQVATINVDGNPSDWSALSPAYSGSQGGNICGIAYDVKDVYTAKDSTYAYVMVETYAPIQGEDVGFEINYDYKPGQDFGHDPFADIHTNVWGSELYVWNCPSLEWGCLIRVPVSNYSVARGDVLEVRIPLWEIENPLYFNPTFINTWYRGMPGYEGCEPIWICYE